jgi:hypothetical protein
MFIVILAMLCRHNAFRHSTHRRSLTLHLQHLQYFEAHEMAPQVLSRCLFSIRNTNDLDNATISFRVQLDLDQTPDQTTPTTNNPTNTPT